MDYLAHVFGILGLISNIVGIQLKKKKDIMIFFVLSNLCFSLNFLLIGANSGAVIGFISTAETLINSLFDKKRKKYPLTLILIYIIVSLIGGSLSYKSMIDILPIISSILFIFIIMQKKERNIRLLTLLFITIFIAYDFAVAAYVPMASAIIYAVSIVISIIRYDVLKKEK